jgi:hypothetical protein
MLGTERVWGLQIFFKFWNICIYTMRYLEEELKAEKEIDLYFTYTLYT